jgi:serine/threonine-protein kinase
MTRAIEANPDDADAHHQRGHAFHRLKRYHEAIADFTAALKARPNNAHLLTSRAFAEAGLNRLDEAITDSEAVLRLNPQGDDRKSLAILCNNLALALATGPAPTRDPARGLNMAQQAVSLAPDPAAHLNTLGVAQYRAGQYADAVATLEKSLAAGKGETDAFDLFFLAMARFKLGELARARLDFDRAVKWHRDHLNLLAQDSTELDTFQAEAQTLLDSPPPERPANVFAPE